MAPDKKIHLANGRAGLRHGMPFPIKRRQNNFTQVLKELGLTGETYKKN
jgi:hypothetical protein